MKSTDYLLGYLQGMAEVIPVAPTPDQWAAIKRKLAVATAPPSDWHEPPFRGDLAGILPQLTC